MNRISQFLTSGRLFGALQLALIANIGFVAACADSETVQNADSAAATNAALADAPAPPNTVLPGANAKPDAVAPASATGSEAKGASVSASDFKSLRWIKGNWAGNAASKTPYFQSFEVVNDTLIAINTYADAGFAAVSETGVIVATGGHAYYGPPSAAWIATKWDGNAIEFTPLKGATNSFVWERVSDNEIRVTLISRDGGVEKKTVHAMKRRSI